ncbi:MAG: MAPEG family protein [Actinobacteria bacterium]|nr:MAPEG family protein [Actinomycetota bacterium]
MSVALVCTALLGLLVFGLGLGVSALRGSTGTNIGHGHDPSDLLHKVVRAHGNAAEYAPMLAILMLAIAARGCTTWMVWTFVAATLFRYLHAAGMLLSPSLDRPQPLRFVGALGTYVSGFALVAAALLVV